MVGKKNFKSVAEVERSIYFTQQQLINRKITAKDATALINLYKLWIQTHKEQKIDELNRRVGGLEEVAKVLQAGGVKDGQ